MNKIACFMTDLDNTIIYSKDKIREDKVCIEERNGELLSFMKSKHYELFEDIRTKISTIPVTTRSLEQYRRIKLFQENVPEFALVSNGGILLKNGTIDQEWLEESKVLIASASEQMVYGAELLESTKDCNFDIRNIDGLFLFTKSNNTEKTYETLVNKLNLSLVSVCINLKKVYVLPKILDKGLATERLKKKCGFSFVIAAGDSSFDASMLEKADIAIGIKGRYPSKLDGKGEIGEAIEKQEVLLWNGDEYEFSGFVLDEVRNKI